MTRRLAFCRHTLLLAAGLLALVALVIPAAVIPPVSADTFPGATPARAVPAFLLIACSHAFAAAVAWRTATRTMSAEKPSRPLFLIPMVLLVLLFAYALEEPGGAYSREGAPMHTASMFLFACAVSDLLVAALMVVATAVFPQQARAV